MLVRVTLLRLLAALPLAPALLLAGCGKQPAAEQDLASLDAELTNGGGNSRDPALTAALADQIMVDPALAQSSNDNVVRPPTRPDAGAVAADTPRADPTRGESLKTAPAAAGDCPECKAAKGALTLGALAERQADAGTAQCAAAVTYSAGWANRLPADLPLYPDARLSEAAGADRNGCALRVVSYATGAAADRVVDWYYTKVTSVGYSAEHKADGGEHVLGGTRGDAAYVVYATPRVGGGTDVDLVSNAGR